MEAFAIDEAGGLKFLKRLRLPVGDLVLEKRRAVEAGSREFWCFRFNHEVNGRKLRRTENILDRPAPACRHVVTW